MPLPSSSRKRPHNLTPASPYRERQILSALAKGAQIDGIVDWLGVSEQSGSQSREPGFSTGPTRPSRCGRTSLGDWASIRRDSVPTRARRWNSSVCIRRVQEERCRTAVKLLPALCAFVLFHQHDRPIRAG